MGPLFDGIYTQKLGYFQIPAASLATAYALSSLPIPKGAKYALIQVEASSVRWRDDGTAPTTTVGMIQAPTDGIVGFMANLQTLQFIAESGSPILDISFYG